MFDYQAPQGLLNDKVILVTGAGDGIGAAAAKAFAAHGATVILLGRTVRKLEAVYDEIEKAGHPQPAIYPLNLETAGEEEFLALAETVEKEFGRLDGLLNNAAFLGSLTPLGQYDLSLWPRVFQVNLHAPYLLTRACLGLLEKAKDGASVIFTSAEVGAQGRAYWGAYGISNAAVENMMQIWADELETNTPIRVNCIDPGAVRTNQRMRAYPGEDPAIHPLPEAIMPAYLYLMGADSKNVNGERILAQA